MAPHDNLKEHYLKLEHRLGMLLTITWSNLTLFPCLSSLTSSWCPSASRYKKWSPPIISSIITGQLSWRNVCHSMGFGYWMDQRPTTVEEVAMFKRQHFHASKAWRKKCPKEQQQAGDSTSAIVNTLVTILMFLGLQVRWWYVNLQHELIFKTSCDNGGLAYFVKITKSNVDFTGLPDFGSM